MQTDKNYYKFNERIGELKYSKERKCHCGGTLIWYDYDEGHDLYMCDECNSQDIVENGKRKFVRLY
jgi:hypothetical protein